MDWNRIEGNWKQLRGKVREKWGQLTDDDLQIQGGNIDQLVGKIQQKTGDREQLALLNRIAKFALRKHPPELVR